MYNRYTKKSFNDNDISSSENSRSARMQLESHVTRNISVSRAHVHLTRVPEISICGAATSPMSLTQSDAGNRVAGEPSIERAIARVKVRAPSRHAYPPRRRWVTWDKCEEFIRRGRAGVVPSTIVKGRKEGSRARAT